jgi:hypothetical protein
MLSSPGSRPTIFGAGDVQKFGLLLHGEFGLAGQ